MCSKEAITTLLEEGIVVDTRINTDLVRDYLYKTSGEISEEEAITILKSTLNHPYFLTGVIEMMGHIALTEYDTIRPK
jgi:hypothetical protein